MKAKSLFLCILVLFLVAGCQAAKVMEMSVPETKLNSITKSDLTLPEVRQAILDACAARHWEAQEINPNSIEARIGVRGEKHSVTVNIVYDTTRWVINYKDSANMMYDGSKIHYKYNEWVERLDKDIINQISRRAK